MNRETDARAVCVHLPHLSLGKRNPLEFAAAAS